MALSVVFKSGYSMAVRLLKECSLPKGKRIIIEPLAENDFLQSFLDTNTVSYAIRGIPQVTT